jgi:hypothetical protein
MAEPYELIIRNKEVFDFYKNTNLDFEHVNILFVDILKKLTLDLDSSLNNNLAAKLLEKFSLLDSKVENISASVTKYQNDLATIFSSKLSEYRKEYVNDLKMILSSNNADCIAPLIRETNSNLLDKTSLMINELIPKNQDKLSNDINLHLKLFQTSMITETSKLMSSSLDKKTIEDFLKNVNQSMGQSQQTLTNLISSTESRIQSQLVETERKINDIKEISTLNNSSQSALQANVTDILKKFENGSSKGSISENITYNILLSLFPCGQIEHVSDQKETGDIILIRNNKPKILIENKDHDTKNVTKQEVEKFIRDCEIQNCCGIMLAQHRGISNKQNFELQVHHGNVLLYVHEANFDQDKIKTAIEIVENFKMKLDELNINSNEECSIPKEILEDINKEFTNYATQKNNMTKLLKDFTEKMFLSLGDLKMPGLEKYLSTKFAFSSIQTENICKYCEKHVAKSMSQHYRYCAAKKEFDSQNEIVVNTSSSK